MSAAVRPRSSTMSWTRCDVMRSRRWRSPGAHADVRTAPLQESLGKATDRLRDIAVDPGASIVDRGGAVIELERRVVEEAELAAGLLEWVEAWGFYRFRWGR